MCLIISQSPYSAVLLGKLRVTHLVKKLSKGSSLPHAHSKPLDPVLSHWNPATILTSLLWRPTSISFFHLSPQLSSGFFIYDFQLKSCIWFLFLPTMLHALTLLFTFCWRAPIMKPLNWLHLSICSPLWFQLFISGLVFIPSLFPSLTIRNQVSCPLKIIQLYIWFRICTWEIRSFMPI